MTDGSGALIPDVAPLTLRRRIHWLALAFVPSSYLLGITTYMTSDVAAVPLLWIIPLALYLLTFILVFMRRPLVPHSVMVRAMPYVVCGLVVTMAAQLTRPVGALIAIHLLTFFVVAMVCHGELARLRPAVSHLTEFYLMLSFGGMLGGVFNAIIAPLIFPIPFEYSIVIAMACVLLPRGSGATAARRINSGRLLIDALLPTLALVLSWAAIVAINLRERGPVTALRNAGVAAPVAAMLAVAIPVGIALMARRRSLRFALCILAILAATTTSMLMMQDLLLVRRSFFGVHRVTQLGRGTPYAFHELFHGTTVHGRQRIDPETGVPISPRLATSYYHRSGPIAQVLSEVLSRPLERRPTNFAVVGLGGGNLAAYPDRGMRMTFYEIDPVVKAIAEDPSLFTYITAARARGAEIDIVLGDARLTLARAPDHSIDVLVLDAFSGDAVPTHLLTAEAVDLYRSKLRDGGLIAFHISNHSIELRPVIASLAAHAGWISRVCDDETRTRQQHAEGKYLSMWMLVAPSERALGKLATDSRWTHPPPVTGEFLWTDDFSNIVRLLKW